MNNQLNISRRKQKYTKDKQKYGENKTKSNKNKRNIKQLPMGQKLILKHAQMFMLHVCKKIIFKSKARLRRIS